MFDVDRLTGKRARIAPETAILPDGIVRVLPQTSGYGCHQVGIVPTDVTLDVKKNSERF